MRRRVIVAAVVLLGGVVPLGMSSPEEATARSAAPACSKQCVERVKQRQLRKQRRAEWRSYKRNPMPWCTWGPESDTDPVLGLDYRGRPWARGRYRIPNRAGGTGGGKFQIMLPTWRAYGGTAYAANPIYASRLHQERVARRIAYAGTVQHRPQGLSAWVNC